MSQGLFSLERVTKNSTSVMKEALVYWSDVPLREQAVNICLMGENKVHKVAAVFVFALGGALFLQDFFV